MGKKTDNSKHPGGRPLLFDTPEQLDTKIQEYFTHCDIGIEKQIPSKGVKGVINTITVAIPYTITGLASFLGTNRQTLLNYSNKEEFFDTIKKAKEKVEADMETRALMGDSNAAVSIFSLKNNFSWKDKQEHDVKVTTLADLDGLSLVELEEQRKKLLEEGNT